MNPSINAVAVVLGERALRGARQADKAVARGGDLPPLHGVPFTIKENIDVAGTATTQGAKAAANSYPSRDAPVVELIGPRFREDLCLDAAAALEDRVGIITPIDQRL